MITLCIDTAYKALVIALYQDETLIDYYEENAERKQSEQVFPTLQMLFEKNNLTVDDIKEIVISDGPGSYTGVRIAMTIAKIMASLKPITLYTISTLQLYKVFDVSVIDAKGGKVFLGADKDYFLPIAEAQAYVQNKKVTIDAHLFDLAAQPFSIAKAFMLKKAEWKKVEDVDALVPRYLKEAI